MQERFVFPQITQRPRNALQALRAVMSKSNFPTYFPVTNYLTDAQQLVPDSPKACPHPLIYLPAQLWEVGKSGVCGETQSVLERACKLHTGSSMG